MKTVPFAPAALLALSASAASALSPDDPALSPEAPALSPDALEALGIHSGSAQELALPARTGASFELEVELGGVPHRLELVPHSLRGPGFRVLVQGADGALVPHTPPAPATYRGHVAGLPGSRVSASLAGGRLEALVHVGDGRTYAIQPPSEDAAPHAVYEAGQLASSELDCGTPDPLLPQGVTTRVAPENGLGLPDFEVCEIACDADFQFYQLNNASVDKTVSDIEKVLIGVEAIYGDQVEILYEIGTIIVRTAEPDPYTSSNPSTLLNQFDVHWSSQQQGVQRDVAHLFTGVNLDGSVIGIAKLGVICSQNNGYGLSQSKYTSSLVLRTRLTAHELGHNWSAPHCNGDPDCGIMCQGGCGPPDLFGSNSQNAIASEQATSGCLSAVTAAPVLTEITPETTAWVPNPVTIVGTDLFTVTSIDWGGTPLGPNAFTALDDLTIEAEPLVPSSLGDVPVTVTTLAGTSNQALVTYVAVDPPQLVAPTNPFSGGLFTWEYGADQNAPAFLIFAFANTTVPVGSVDVLLPAVLVSAGNLDAAGLGSFSTVFPSLPPLSFLYTQLVTADGPELKASDVETSIVLF